MAYNLNYTEVSRARLTSVFENVSPQDYIDCETEEQVRQAILEDYCFADPGDWDFFECESFDLDIPEEFFAEWRIAKRDN